MKKYKLTDIDFLTRNKTKWGPKVTHIAKGKGTELCSDGYIHWYHTPELAAVMYMSNVIFNKPVLWEAKVSEPFLDDDGLKGGSKKVTTIKQVPLPYFSNEELLRICKTLVDETKDVDKQTSIKNYYEMAKWYKDTNKSMDIIRHNIEYYTSISCRRAVVIKKYPTEKLQKLLEKVLNEKEKPADTKPVKRNKKTVK